MRGLWVAVLGAGLMVSGGAVAQTANANTAQRMCKADVKAQRKTQKAEAKAAKNNAKAAEDQIRAQARQGRAGNGAPREQALAVVLTPPPM
jgi:Flp pilus assembly protein TadB